MANITESDWNLPPKNYECMYVKQTMIHYQSPMSKPKSNKPSLTRPMSKHRTRPYELYQFMNY